MKRHVLTVYAFFDSLKATLMTLAVASTCPIDLVTPTFRM